MRFCVSFTYCVQKQKYRIQRIRYLRHLFVITSILAPIPNQAANAFKGNITAGAAERPEESGLPEPT